MFVGHALLAFALAALAARHREWPRERALAAGLVAGAFAALPDVDIVYAPVGLLGADGPMDAATGFWAASTLVHRGLTHSVVVAAVAAVGFAAWTVAARDDTELRSRGAIARGLALAILAGLVALGIVTGGALGGVVMAAFVAVGLAITGGAMRWTDLDPGSFLALAAFGLASHPFGDLLTGQPPQLLAPLDATLIADRVALSPDPTLHVVGAFVIELGVIWLAATVYCRLTDRRLAALVQGRAALGLAYAGAVLLIPPPTLSNSYIFVFSVLAVGIVGPAPLAWRVRTLRDILSPVGSADRDRSARSDGGDGTVIATETIIESDAALSAILTGLAAITLAALAYAVAYSLG